MLICRRKMPDLLEDSGSFCWNQAHLKPNISGIKTKSIGNVCGDVTDIWF
jgi:hypothetical protein